VTPRVRLDPPMNTTNALVDRAVERHALWPMIVSILSYRELLRNLVLKDLKLKYRGSVLGFLWSLVNPLALTAVYTLAFRYILRIGQPGFPFFVLLGVLAWSFFVNAATMSTVAIIDGASLVKAVRFPRAVLPIATVFFNLAQYLLSVLVLLPAMFLLYRVPPSGPMLLFPLILGLQVAFTIGLALVLSVATASFRDVRHFVEVALWALFWTTPIVYPLAQVPESKQWLILLSPMSSFIVAYQRIFYEGVWPGVNILTVCGVYAVVMLVGGALWFVSVEERLVERL
jgi:lipopolysaccharide transport system permease protein